MCQSSLYLEASLFHFSLCILHSIWLEVCTVTVLFNKLQQMNKMRRPSPPTPMPLSPSPLSSFVVVTAIVVWFIRFPCHNSLYALYNSNIAQMRTNGLSIVDANTNISEKIWKFSCVVFPPPSRPFNLFWVTRSFHFITHSFSIFFSLLLSDVRTFSSRLKYFWSIRAESRRSKFFFFFFNFRDQINQQSIEYFWL